MKQISIELSNETYAHLATQAGRQQVSVEEMIVAALERPQEGATDAFETLSPSDLEFIKRRLDEADASSARGESVDGREFLLQLRLETEGVVKSQH